MTKQELLTLSPSVALRVLVDLLGDDFERRLERVEKPREPRSPKFDFRIRRKSGFAWASETDLDGLRFWCGRYKESAAAGTQYSERDQRNAEKLAYWIAWREVNPKEPWSGQRNDDAVTAAVPSHKPRIYEWEKREEPANKGDAYEEPGGDNSFPPGW